MTLNTPKSLSNNYFLAPGFVQDEWSVLNRYWVNGLSYKKILKCGIAKYKSNKEREVTVKKIS